MMLFLGDGLRDAAAVEHVYPDLPVYKVYGNCDIMPPKDVPRERELFVEGHRIWMTHGHFQSVKMGLHEITQEARARGIDLVLFGHTHRQISEQSGSLKLCNPGSISPMGNEHYAVIQIEEAGIFISLEQT